jgi:hypothetical protein
VARIIRNTLPVEGDRVLILPDASDTAYWVSRAGSVELAGLFSFDSGGVPRLQRRSKLVSDWFRRLSVF